MSTNLNWSWQLEICYNPQELGEPYELYFFLGPIPSSPSDWRYSPSGIFEPIMSHGGTMIRDFRFLNGYLEDYCGNEMKDDEVIPYLRKHLTWRVKRYHEDEEIDSSELNEFKVTVLGPGGATTFRDGASE